MGISLEIDDLEEQVENCRNDLAWGELPLSAKLRVLIKERLAQLEAQKKQLKDESQSHARSP
ncbi:hypothetical protein IQ249_15025 [Lusitaniella coriacea LEGE 07157]|uniref:Uncharacterized protein n=1 Tax=Lusitaniella coriacea LEGE 07157 TaxID=945747 RepID=A0A8J7DXP3_9CYAN|nr:hypothetical protein [Lusitaniella coriacea]MBE9117211.1 hypothetical protein [Lusitaniella coriacea LEGE 07157]